MRHKSKPRSPLIPNRKPGKDFPDQIGNQKYRENRDIFDSHDPAIYERIHLSHSLWIQFVMQRFSFCLAKMYNAHGADGKTHFTFTRNPICSIDPGFSAQGAGAARYHIYHIKFILKNTVFGCNSSKRYIINIIFLVVNIRR